MEDFTELVDVPPAEDMNSGLHSASEATMLAIFGRPGPLTADCSDATNPDVEALLVTADVGPFRVRGLRPAVESLQELFDQLKQECPDLYAAVKTDGMFCCRHKRRNPAEYSNHSWDTAIDLHFGDGPVPQGEPKTERGVLELYPHFHAHGWYWGAGFSGASVDSMHFELSEEVVRTLAAQPLAG